MRKLQVSWKRDGPHYLCSVNEYTIKIKKNNNYNNNRNRFNGKVILYIAILIIVTVSMFINMYIGYGWLTIHEINANGWR